VLSTGEQSIPALSEQDSSDVLTGFLVEYLEQNTPEGTLEEVYRLAEASHLAEKPEADADWSHYVRRDGACSKPRPSCWVGDRVR
jgi:hypothetical protein